MAHKRKDIRAAVLTMLTGATDAGANVFSNRTYNYEQAELPSLNINLDSETAVPRSLSSRQSIRNIKMRIEVRAEANDDVEGILDDIATQIEDIFEQDRSLSGTAISTIYQQTENEVDSNGERIVGKMILTFEVQYID